MEGIIKLLPYVKIDGISTMADSELLELYNKFVEQNLAETIWSDGSVTNGEEFLADMSNPKTLLFVPHFFPDDVRLPSEPMGIIWLNRLERTTAEGHLGYFKEFWGRDRTIRASRLFIRMATNAFCETLIGVIPSHNRTACAHVREIGFNELGSVPAFMYNAKRKKSVAATIFYINKEDFKDENIH